MHGPKADVLLPLSINAEQQCHARPAQAAGVAWIGRCRSQESLDRLHWRSVLLNLVVLVAELWLVGIDGCLSS